MTKQEVRAAILAKLSITPQDICWDIGAGTGSVSVELAMHAKSVWAVEYQQEALELIQRNREKFGAWNLRIVRGRASEVLSSLPRPDAVFIGGSGGELPELLRQIREINPRAKICISAISIETLNTACKELSESSWSCEIVQISVSRCKNTGGLHLLMAQNPVFLITGVHP